MKVKKANKMVKIDGVNLNITKELQDFLLQNAPKSIKKAVVSKISDDKGDLLQKKDEEGNPMFVNASSNKYKNVYFDTLGNHHFRVFRTKIIDGKEIIVTNPKIEIEKDCTLYARGIPSHKIKIPGSDLWDNGSQSTMFHTEMVSKGDPIFKIIKVMTREEVIAVDIKPQGNSIAATIANATDAEKKVIIEQLLGSNFLEEMSRLKGE